MDSVEGEERGWALLRSVGRVAGTRAESSRSDSADSMESICEFFRISTHPPCCGLDTPERGRSWTAGNDGIAGARSPVMTDVAPVGL